MLYRLLRPVVRMAFRVFYRKIYLTGREHIVPKGPVLFTLNHPTAFIEPCLMACYSGRNLYFMTRGDFFINGVVRWLMAQVHLIPIFRFRDGFANLRRNEMSFVTAKKMLARGDVVLIMAEGAMRHEKRLRPIQRGAARIGFDAILTHNLEDVPVQAIGVNYTYANFIRTEVMVDIAPAFSLREYMDLYIENAPAAIDAVTTRISEELKKRVVHIDDPGDEELAEFLLQLVRNSLPRRNFPVVEYSYNRLPVEKTCVDVLNKLSEGEKVKLKTETTTYFQTLRLEKLHDRIVARNAPGKAGGLFKFFRYYFFASIYWLGKILYALPVFISRRLAYRIEIVEFHSSVMLGMTLLTGMVWVILCFIVMLFVAGWWGALAISALLIGMIPVWVWAAEGYQQEVDDRLWLSTGDEQRTRLVKMRQVLLDKLQVLGLFSEINGG